jgi:hypothetical protein
VCRGKGMVGRTRIVQPGSAHAPNSSAVVERERRAVAMLFAAAENEEAIQTCPLLRHLHHVCGIPADELSTKATI